MHRGAKLGDTCIFVGGSPRVPLDPTDRFHCEPDQSFENNDTDHAEKIRKPFHFTASHDSSCSPAGRPSSWVLRYSGSARLWFRFQEVSVARSCRQREPDSKREPDSRRASSVANVRDATSWESRPAAWRKRSPHQQLQLLFKLHSQVLFPASRVLSRVLRGQLCQTAYFAKKTICRLEMLLQTQVFPTSIAHLSLAFISVFSFTGTQTDVSFPTLKSRKFVLRRSAAVRARLSPHYTKRPRCAQWTVV